MRMIISVVNEQETTPWMLKSKPIFLPVPQFPEAEKEKIYKK
jgi:hypothetical protein